MRSLAGRLWQKLFTAVPIGPLVQIRVALGLILLWESYRYLHNDWPQRLFLDPEILFKYYGFGWVRHLPPDWHLALYWILPVLAISFTIGFLYRISAVLLFLGWAYSFLLDQSLYLNHMYLVLIVLGVMIILPAHRAFSIDALWRTDFTRPTVPRWTIDLLRFQVAVVYFFGGIAKLNLDWLSGVPMQMMLLANTGDFGALSDQFAEWAGEPVTALLFAYGGLALDLGLVPLLCWKKTRLIGLLWAAGFHVLNHLLFQIGIFPWMMLAATIILWPPVRLSMLNFARLYGALVVAGMVLTRLTHPPEVPERTVPDWAWAAVLIVGAILIFPPESWKRFAFERVNKCESPPVRSRPLVGVFLTVFVFWQVAMPLRHFVYPGNVSWTEACHKWSWHMKLRIKIPDRSVYFVRDGEGNLLETVRPFSRESILTPRQAETVSTRPDMALEFAHYLRDRAEEKYGQPVRITMDNTVSLNGRPFQPIIDPEANLAAIEARLWPPAEWIVPLTTPRHPLIPLDADQIEGIFDYIEARYPGWER